MPAAQFAASLLQGLLNLVSRLPVFDAKKSCCSRGLEPSPLPLFFVLFGETLLVLHSTKQGYMWGNVPDTLCYSLIVPRRPPKSAA